MSKAAAATMPALFVGHGNPDAVPPPDHYLPLLYVLGARRPGGTVRFPVEGMDGGSVSMLAVELAEDG